MVEILSSKHKALSSNPSTAKKQQQKELSTLKMSSFHNWNSLLISLKPFKFEKKKKRRRI
jgi:hypothetical protein